MNLLNLLSFICLCMPTAIELYGDRKGDFSKRVDVIYRTLFMFGFGILAWLTIKERTILDLLICINLSFAIFFLFFDYLIAAILIHNGTLEPPQGVKYHWFDYEAKKGVIDNLKFWKNMNPYVKLLIRVTYFVIALILYFTV